MVSSAYFWAINPHKRTPKLNKNQMLHRTQLNTSKRQHTITKDSFYFSDRTSQYITQSNQRLLWPSHVARKFTTVNVQPNAKENGTFFRKILNVFFFSKLWKFRKKNQNFSKFQKFQNSLFSNCTRKRNLFVKILGHSDIFNRHYMLIGSDNQLIVISLDECKMEEIDNVNEFTTLKEYFVVVSSDLQTSLYRHIRVGNSLNLYPEII